MISIESFTLSANPVLCTRIAQRTPRSGNPA